MAAPAPPTIKSRPNPPNVVNRPKAVPPNASISPPISTSTTTPSPTTTPAAGPSNKPIGTSNSNNINSNTTPNAPNAPNASTAPIRPKVAVPNAPNARNSRKTPVSSVALIDPTVVAPAIANAPGAVVLAKGDYVGATFDDLVIAVINYNTSLNKAHLIKERKPKRIGIICSGVREEACEFKAYASKTNYGIRITTFCPHNCTGGPNRRQFNSSVIANIAPMSFPFEKNPDINIRQIQELVRNQTGFNVSSGQAHRIIHKNRNGKPPKQQNELTLFLELLKKEDPQGTYKFELYDDGAQFAGEYRRCFIVPAGILSSVSYYNGLVSANYSTIANGMQLILLTAHDSNNEITLLGFALCRNDAPSANADNWAWFVRNAMEAMPYLRAIISAEVEGFETEQMRAALQSRSIVHLWCSSHIIGQEIYPEGRDSQVGENLVAELMKARTSAEKEKLLKDTVDENDTRFLDWWKSVEMKCATYKLLDANGCHRHGKIYSNTIEELGTPHDLEEKSSIEVIVALIEHMSQVGIARFKAAKLHAAKNSGGYVYRQTLTPYAAAQHQLALDEAETLTCHPKMRTVHGAATFQCGVTAKREKGKTFKHKHKRRYNVTLGEDYAAECDCRHGEEFLRPCAHVAAAIKKAREMTGNETTYDAWRAEWFDAFWTNENLLKQHTNVVKSLREEGSVELMKLPQKRRKRRKRNYQPSAKNPRKCKRCGGSGHFAITCQRKAT